MSNDVAELTYRDYSNDELLEAEYWSACRGWCPICREGLDHCGSGHDDNCPIHKVVCVSAS